MSVALFLLPESAPLPLSDLIKYWNLYRFGGDNFVFEGQALAYRLTFVNF